jgi:MoxR-like ATPase
MDITPEGSLEPDAAARLQEGHALLIGAPGRGKTVALHRVSYETHTPLEGSPSGWT